jgi:hypothetical protein
LVWESACNHFLWFESVVLVKSFGQNLLVWLLIYLIDNETSLRDASLANSEVISIMWHADSSYTFGIGSSCEEMLLTVF